MMTIIRLLVFAVILLIVSIQGFPKELGDFNNVIVYEKAKGELSDKFYPIGFSAEGHFCYIKIPADEAVGCFLWNFDIFNLVNDRKEYSVRFKHEDCDSIKDINSLFKEYGILFRNKMISFDIKRANSKIRKFPLKTSDDTITSVLKRIKRIKGKHGFFKTIFFLYIHSEKYGSKIAAKVVEKSSESIPFIYNSKVNGYIKSPFENRVAVIIEQEVRGWEGPPNVSTFRIFGASLDKGFSKRTK